MHCIILILLVLKTEAIIQLGRIQNANWVLNFSLIDNKYINISNITCDQCLCRMLEMNNLTTSIACQEERKTCQLLFWNATAQLQIEQRSVIYFQTIPKFLQTTTNQQSMTTSINSMFSSAVTTKTITSSAAITSMNNPSRIITTVSKTLTTATTVVPNLLINPGGELGYLSPWTPNGPPGPLLDKNGTNSSRNILSYNGSYAFYGGLGGGSLHQNVLLANTFSTAQLDSGLLRASISFWELTWDQSATDTGQVILIFLSNTNNTLSSVTTGPKACISTWCHVTSNWSVPANTRTIDYMMKFVANIGSSADAWIDDNLLSVG